jgi:hypothetical protein
MQSVQPLLLGRELDMSVRSGAEQRDLLTCEAECVEHLLQNGQLNLPSREDGRSGGGAADPAEQLSFMAYRQFMGNAAATAGGLSHSHPGVPACESGFAPCIPSMHVSLDSPPCRRALC